MTETVLDNLVVKVRADTSGVQSSLARMTADLSLISVGAESAGRRMENAFVRFARTGEFNFKSLKELALGVLGDIAAAAVRTGLDQLLGSIGGGGGGHGGLFSGLGNLLGLPGRATGGLVSAGQPYMIGERGPEVFVPSQAGRVQATGPSVARHFAITINMNGNTSVARTSGQSASQVATAVRRAIARSEGLA
jgi:phage-related minor tail protein